MAKLLDATALGQRPVPTPAGGTATFQPQSGEGEVAEALVGVGQAFADLGEDLAREQERINTLRAEDAFNRYRQRQLDLSVGEDGFIHVKGQDAVTRPILKEYTTQLEDAGKEITQSLANDEQREKFKRRAEVASLQFQEGILRHLATEGETYAKQVYDGILATEQQNAVARWDSPNDVLLSLERITNAVNERAESNGWEAEYKDLVLQEATGKVHAAVIEQAIASGNNTYAEEWYKTHRDSIDVETAKQLEVSVRNGTQKDLTNAYNARFLASDDDFEALEALRREVLGDKVLTEDRRNILVRRIQSRQSILERRSEVEHERFLGRLEKGIEQLNANTLAGFEPTPEQFEPLLEATEGTALEAQAQAALRLADATRDFRNSPPLVQEQMLTQAETALREDPTKFDRNILTAWKRIHENQRQQVQDSPISFAVRQGIIEPPEPLDLANPTEATDALAERFAIARGVSARYQAPFKPLTTEEVTLLQATLDDASVVQKRNYFSALAEAAGDDKQGYMALMAQLSPDDPVTAIAGSHAAMERTQSADLMLRGQSILHPPTKADGRPDSGLLPMPSETDMRAEFDSHVRETFAGKAETRNALYQSAKAIYAALSVDAGDSDTKVLDSDRWQQAMDLAIGPIEKHNGRRIVLPHGVEFGDFRDSLEDRVVDLLDESLTARSRVSVIEQSMTPQERAIIKYHENTLRTQTVGRDEQGRMVTVFATTIEIPEGPHAGEFVTVPGYFDGRIHMDEGEIWAKWRDQINAGKWPIYETGEEGGRRAALIHELIEPMGNLLDPSWTAGRLLDLPLENIGDGRYVFRSGDGVVTDLRGIPVILDFNTPAPSRHKPLGTFPEDVTLGGL